MKKSWQMMITICRFLEHIYERTIILPKIKTTWLIEKLI